MSWIGASSSTQRPMFHPDGLDAGRFTEQVPKHTMPRGTLLLDIIMPDNPEHPLDLIDYEKWQGYRRSLSLLLDPNGKLWLANEQGSDLQIASLDIASFPAGALVRIAFSWDVHAGISCLSAQNVTTGEIKLKNFKQTAALAMDDLARILFCTTGRFLHDSILTFLMSDQVEKLGYFAGLGSSALVSTELGPIPIEHVKPGDLVITHDGDLSPVVATLKSRTPAFGHMRPVELRRPFLNLSQSLVVSADTSVIMEGNDAEYYFGCEAVSISARHIAPFIPLPYANPAPLVTLHQLVLQTFKPFCASGAAFLPVVPTHDVSNPQVHARTRLAALPPDRLNFQNTRTAKPSDSYYDQPRGLFEHEATVLLSERYL